MRTIHKYVLSDVTNEVPTFEGARFLHVANQADQITVWAEVETLTRECTRVVHVVGTGQPVPTGPVDYIGSVLMAGGVFVFHVHAEIQR